MKLIGTLTACLGIYNNCWQGNPLGIVFIFCGLSVFFPRKMEGETNSI